MGSFTQANVQCTLDKGHTCALSLREEIGQLEEEKGSWDRIRKGRRKDERKDGHKVNSQS